MKKNKRKVMLFVTVLLVAILGNVSLLCADANAWLDEYEQAGLVDIAKSDADKDVRSAAIDRLHDQKALVGFAKNDKDVQVRVRAVHKLNADEHQAFLTELATKDKEWWVREMASKKISNQTLLAGIAKNDEVVRVRLAATERLDDQAVLAEIVSNDADRYVRRAAIDRIDDQPTLAEIAKKDKDEWMRQEAVVKLNDRAILEGIAKGDHNERMRYLAAHRLNAVPTPEEQERNDWLQKLRSPIPYLDERSRIQNVFYTFGQAAKRCERVAVGVVETVRETTPADSREGILFVEGQRVVLSIDASLYGKGDKKTLTFTIMETMVIHGPLDIEQRVVKPGDRVLVFLSDKWYNIIYLLSNPPGNPQYFDFDRSKAKWDKADMHVLAHIILDDKESEREVISAAKRYLGFFGEKGKRDRDTYCEFLCSLLQSPVKRIRDDAESDLVLFHTREKDPPPDLDKLLADGRVRKEVKDYLRYLLRNEKPKEE